MAFAEQLTVEENWVVYDDRGFDWLGSSFPFHLEVSQPRLAFDQPIVKVTVMCKMVERVSVDEGAVLSYLRVLNMGAITSAFVYDPDDAALSLSSGCYFRESEDALVSLYALSALLQYSEAIAKGASAAEMLGGTIPFLRHPISGVRVDCNQLVWRYMDEIALPAGREPNRFESQEWYSAVEAVRETMVAMGASSAEAAIRVNACDTGLAIEFPFTSAAPALEQAGGYSADHGMTALFEIDVAEHPSMGQGVLALLQLPELWENAAHLANGLNRAEALELTGFPQWGGWCDYDVPERTDRSLTHALFVPNVMWRPGLIEALITWASLRNRWAQERVVDAARLDRLRRGR
jgi:hypothetical protein